MRYFDFSDSVRRAVEEAESEEARLSAKTTVQRRELPGAVTKAGFRFLSRSSSFHPGSNDLVIGVASWSDRDLAALEGVATQRQPRLEVTVFDIDDLDAHEMSSLFPGFRLFTRTPVVMHYRDGVLEFLGEGCDAILWLLRELSRMNITSASLFPGMDGYARSIRETYESLDDEAPAYRQIALETMEDLGWTG